MMIPDVIYLHGIIDGAYYAPVAVSEIENPAATVAIDIPRSIDVIEIAAPPFAGNKNKVKLGINVNLAPGYVNRERSNDGISGAHYCNYPLLLMVILMRTMEVKLRL